MSLEPFLASRFCGFVVAKAAEAPEEGVWVVEDHIVADGFLEVEMEVTEAEGDAAEAMAAEAEVMVEAEAIKM